MARFLAGVLTGVVVVLLAGFLTLMWLVPGSNAPPPPLPPVPTQVPSPGPGETVLGRAALTSVLVQTTAGTLADVSASGQGVTLSDQGIRANQLTINATLPFSTIADQVGGGIELFAVSTTRAGVRKRITILGRDVDVTAVASVGAENGQLVITPQSVDLGGPGWIDGAASGALRQIGTIRHTVEGLPDGMHLVAVSVADTGFRARLEGSQVAITR